MSIIAQAVENKALEIVVSQAEHKTRSFLCTDCLDRRCLKGIVCKAFHLLTQSYAWEIVAEKAELN